MPSLDFFTHHRQKIGKGREGRPKTGDNPNDFGQVSVGPHNPVRIDNQVLTSRKQD